jgi:hypothetical protein
LGFGGDKKKGDIVNHLDFERHLVRQHNKEMLREVRMQRLRGQLRNNSQAPSGRSHTHNLIWWSVHALLQEWATPNSSSP